MSMNKPFQFEKPGTYSIPASVLHLDSKVPLKLEAAPVEEAPAEDNAEAVADSGKHPIAMLARTGEAIEHWYWGKIVHDLAGFKLLKDKVTVDWCHDYSQSIGYLDQFSVDEAGLNTKGFLIPYGEDDIVNEVITKGKAGIPYEASIDWSGQGTRIEFVPEGISTQANGKSFDGPIYVVREWPLTAVALCPHGADPGTLTQFAKHDAVEINIFTAEAPAEVKEEAPVEKTEVAAVEIKDVHAEEKQEQPAPVEQAAKVDPLADLKLFVGTFGPAATQWLIDGKSFAECTKLALADLTEKLSAKDVEIADLKKRLSEVKLGEAEPVTFSAVDIVAEDVGTSHLSEAARKWVAAYKGKLPRK